MTCSHELGRIGLLGRENAALLNAALSGALEGVDSATAAVLVHKAVGDQLTCVFVDHGLLRKGEAEQVEDTFRRHFHVPLVHVKSRERFLGKLAGVTEPEEKRKVIGEEFIRTFEEESHKLGKARYLVQGTIYPDVIESGTSSAAVIKSHHNVGGLPDDVDFELVEPLRMLFKDEVRVVGQELGRTEDLVWRQPFPGPGLAIRIVGEVTQERLDILREADAILIGEVKKAGLYRELWQSFAVLAAIRSVGVMGDERTYAYPIIIRAVTSSDAMTLSAAEGLYDYSSYFSSIPDPDHYLVGHSRFSMLLTGTLTTLADGALLELSAPEDIIIRGNINVLTSERWTPLAFATAQSLEVQPQAFLMAVGIAASMAAGSTSLVPKVST